MSYQHFSLLERTCIGLLLKYADISQHMISKTINRSASSVSREIMRNGGRCNYSPILAQERYISNRKLSKRAIKLDDKELYSFIVEKIKKHWSPEQISVFLSVSNKSICISFSSIYRYIYNGLLEGVSSSNLRHKGKKRTSAKSRSRIRDGKSIHQRERIVDERSRIGDFEIDTILSGYKSENKCCLLSAVDRKSGYLIAVKLQNKKSSSVLEAIEKIVKSNKTNIFKTITSDNGLEFAMHKQIERVTKADYYFADPYCSWQRGTNENTNGLIREFYTKGFDFSGVDQSEIDCVVELINNRHRKRLKYKTPKEVFAQNTCCT